MAGGTRGGLYSQTVTSYRGGVSQQPSILRYPDQLEEQINAFPSLVDGLQKRPPTIHVKRLDSKIDYNAVKFHTINRDDNEQYILEMSNGNLRVWDLQGNQKTVTFPNGKDYLRVNNARQDFRAITIADYTFILNRTVTTSMKPDVIGDYNNGRVLYEVKSVQYGKSLAIFVDNNQFLMGVHVADGSNASDSNYATTARVASDFYKIANHDYDGTWGFHYSYSDLMNVSAAGTNVYGRHKSINIPATYESGIVGDGVFWLRKRAGGSFSTYVKDGMGGTGLYVYPATASSASKLPSSAPSGYVIKVKGDTEANEDDYYVRWNTGEQLWQESLANGIKFRIEETSMPWVLIRQADGSFKFKPYEWAERKVGDDDTNPVPTFIGKTINDIFFYRDRLGFLSDESVILSCSGDYSNFWYKSAITINDTDPIDVSVSSNKVAILTDAIPFFRELMLFSREGQFVLSSDGVLTPKSVKVDQMTSFNYSDETRPLAVGQSIFFINNRINFCSLMRYYTVQDVADLKSAEDISQHIPSYIPKGIYSISGNSTENTLLLLSDYQPNTVWVYKFADTNGQLTQSAWGKWTFGYEGSQVCLAEFYNADMYFLINNDEGLFLERATLTGNVVDLSNEKVRLFIDRKVEYTVPSSSSYDAYNGVTTVSFTNIYGAPPKVGSCTYYLIDPNGDVITVTEWDSRGNFKVNEDIRGKTFFVGRKYEFMVELSQVALKMNENNNITTESEGKLQLRNYTLNYNDSGVFSVVVENKSKHQKYTYKNTAKFLGTSSTTLGAYDTYTDAFRVPIQDCNKDISIKIISDSPSPLSIISGSWEGYYIRRSMRV